MLSRTRFRAQLLAVQTSPASIGPALKPLRALSTLLIRTIVITL
jgi:hypothetical protein